MDEACNAASGSVYRRTPTVRASRWSEEGVRTNLPAQSGRTGAGGASALRPVVEESVFAGGSASTDTLLTKRTKILLQQLEVGERRRPPRRPVITKRYGFLFIHSFIHNLTIANLFFRIFVLYCYLIFFYKF